MNKFKSFLFVVSGFAIAFLSGCATINEQSIVYVPEPSLSKEEPLINGLFIEKIRKEQPNEEILPFNPNNDPWILIPFCFYSGQKVDPVIKRNYFQNNLDVALQRLFVKDLNASGISKTIISADSNNPDIKPWHDKYRLELVLKHAVWNRNLTAYGLSYPGTFLWTIGFPTSYGNIQLEIDAVLYPPRPSKKPIGKFTLKKEDTCVEFIYDQVGYQPSVSETVLTEMFPDIAKDLRNFLRKTLKK